MEASVEGLEVVTFRLSGTATPPVVGGAPVWPLPTGASLRLGKGRIAYGHGGIAFSPNGEILAVATLHSGIWLYDVATSREVARMAGGPVRAIAFSPDGSTLASCADHREDFVRLWDVATGNQVAVLEKVWGVRSVAFSPDGRTLASGSDYGLELWDLETGTQVASASSWAEGTWAIRSVAFSPDGQTLAAGSGMFESVTLWDVATFTRTATFEGHSDRVTAVAFSPDGRNCRFRVVGPHGPALGCGHRVQCRHL